MTTIRRRKRPGDVVKKSPPHDYSASVSLSVCLRHLRSADRHLLAVRTAFPAQHVRPSGVLSCWPDGQGPDLQNILRQSSDYLTIMPKLRSTYDGRLIYKTSYEGRKAFLRYDSLAEL